MEIKVGDKFIRILGNNIDCWYPGKIYQLKYKDITNGVTRWYMTTDDLSRLEMAVTLDDPTIWQKVEDEKMGKYNIGQEFMAKDQKDPTFGKGNRFTLIRYDIPNVVILKKNSSILSKFPITLKELDWYFIPVDGVIFDSVMTELPKGSENSSSIVDKLKANSWNELIPEKEPKEEFIRARKEIENVKGTLESKTTKPEPKFKVGDRVKVINDKSICNGKSGIIDAIGSFSYHVAFEGNSLYSSWTTQENNLELIPETGAKEKEELRAEFQEFQATRSPFSGVVFKSKAEKNLLDTTNRCEPEKKEPKYFGIKKALKLAKKGYKLKSISFPGHSLSYDGEYFIKHDILNISTQYQSLKYILIKDWYVVEDKNELELLHEKEKITEGSKPKS